MQLQATAKESMGKARPGGVRRWCGRWCQVRKWLEQVVQVAAKVVVGVVKEIGARLCKFRWSLLIFLVDLHHIWPRLWMVSGLEKMVA